MAGIHLICGSPKQDMLAFPGNLLSPLLVHIKVATRSFNSDYKFHKWITLLGNMTGPKLAINVAALIQYCIFSVCLCFLELYVAKWLQITAQCWILWKTTMQYGLISHQNNTNNKSQERVVCTIAQGINDIPTVPSSCYEVILNLTLFGL